MKKVNNIGYQIIRPFLKLFILITVWPKTINKEYIPKSGGYILAGNHVSYYDPLVVGNACPRSIHFLAKKELFDNKFLGAILRFMGIIRVDRSTKNPLAKEEALNALKTGNVVCIFPEGTTKKKGDDVVLKPFKYGAVSFASKSNVPIIPFAIINKPKVFKYNTKIVFGKPIYVKENDDLELSNKKLEKTVKSLLLK